MAITSFERFNNKNITQSSCSKSSYSSSNKLIKCSCDADGGISNSNEYGSKKTRNIPTNLNGDRINLHSRVTEKKLVQERTTDFISSFPLAVNIYKANSDHLRSSKRPSKKVKKSVLTLPNEQTPLPQACTVSDLNDSEFFNDSKVNVKSKTKKRRSVKNHKYPVRSRELEVFDTDSKYLTNINRYTGDGQKVKKSHKRSDVSNQNNVKAHDVWSFLRDINKFQFRPSPSMSQDSFMSIKIGKNRNRRRINHRDARYIETSRTEEFACISSFVDEDPFQNVHSQSSTDRITVISRKDNYQEINKISYQANIGDIKNIKSNNATKVQKKRKKRTDSKLKHFDINREKTVWNDKLDVETISNEQIQSDKNFEQKEKESIIDTPIINNRSLHKKSTVNSCQLNINKNDDKLISSDNSKASKSNLNNIMLTKIDNKNIEKTNSENVTGITKVVLSKGQKILLTKQLDAEKRKPRMTTTLPNNSIIPKMTQTEIKRRLSCIRFPLIILGKDQVSSSFKVETYDPPQFEGLNEHIWPFMKNWFQKDRFNKYENDIKEKFCLNKFKNLKCNSDKLSKDDNYNSNNRKVIGTSLRDPKIDPSISIRAKKSASSVKEPLVQRIKPISTVKNKMMNFIHKKTDFKTNTKKNSMITYSKIDSQDEASVANDNVTNRTNTRNILTMTKQSSTILKKDERNNRSSFSKSGQWAKRKWASDFIENVIKKIKSGVYFYQEGEPKECNNNIMEESAQTETVDRSSNCLEAGNIGPIVLPGFDDRLSDLEIETIESYNHIAVKHCVTNTVIQFDIALKPEFNFKQISKSFSCIPMQDTNNLKIFKCKTTILNAVLPAELCTVLPNLMQKILKTNYNLVYPTSAIEKVGDNLPPITEISQCENQHEIQLFLPKQVSGTSGERTFENGKFTKISQKQNHNIKRWSQAMLDLMDIQGILMRIQMNSLKNSLIESALSSPIIIHFNTSNPKPNGSDLNRLEKSTCLTIQPYLVSNKRIYPAFKIINFITLAESLLCHKFLNLNVNSPLINNFKVILHNNYNVSILIKTTNIAEFAPIKYSIPDEQVNSICNGNKSSLKNKENKDLACILDRSTSMSDRRYTDKPKLRKPAQYCISNKRRGFSRLYKKCKSMSSLQHERSSTELNKITSLDEFFLALGSSKALSSALDGNLEQKIMSAVNEMKNWTTVITPRQALLVLLLAHKKETSNLIRYRPMILQGISVNRITRSTELDMEIEVIVTENLNSFSKYNEINYLPATVENQDNLFEELCWIAKTTASDYQKIFDESSEKHLKLLLEKRKKLSPSYLRVMARYIGLGLLKPPKSLR